MAGEAAMARTSPGDAGEHECGGVELACAEAWGWRWPPLIALWFGVVAGLVELLLLVIRVELLEKGFFLRSRHFVWMVPLSDVFIFGVVGLLMIVRWPRIGRLPNRIVIAVLLFLGLMSQLLLLRRVNFLSCALFAAGLAYQASRWFASRWRGFISAVRWSVPLLASILAGVVAVTVMRNGGSSSTASGSSVRTARCAECAFDCAGHGSRRSPERLRISPRDVAAPGTAGRARRSIRPRAFGRAVDAAVARQSVYWLLAA